MVERVKTEKIIAMLIVTIMIFTIVPLSSVAAEQNQINSIETILLMERDRPEVISRELVRENKHAYRLSEEEAGLDEILFLNSDDTATLYSFSEPVKYMDTTGVIRDKSNALFSSFDIPDYSDKYAYVNSANDIKTYFPKTLSESIGVLLEGNGCQIELVPIGNTATQRKTSSQDSEYKRDYVFYDGVFGKDTTIRYTPTFSGFKEDIILMSNKGNKFSFILRTGGLNAVQNDTEILLTDPKTGEVLALIESVYVFDSYDGGAGPNGTYNNLVNLSILDDSDIEITIIVDSEFLSSPDTKYPVYIDPSVTINTSGSGSSKTIQDCPIYDGTGARALASGSNTFNLVGYVGLVSNVQYGVGRTLMRFPGLLNNAYYQNVPAAQITNVTLYITESSGQSSSATIAAYQYTGASTWVETSANYNNTTWNGYGTLYGSASVGSSGATTMSINITSGVKAWKSNTTYANAGIMLRNITSETSSSYRKDLRATENTSTKPYVSMTFTWYGCKPYYSTTSQTMNCHGYAFWTHNDPQSWYTSADVTYWYSTATLSQKLDRTKQRIEANWLPANFPGGRWENVTSQGTGATLNEKQWLVVMRVGYVNDNTRNVFDYHFWYRTNNGQWSNKHGRAGYSELLPSSDTPSTNSSAGWKLYNYSPFYSSSLIYYRVTMP